MRVVNLTKIYKDGKNELKVLDNINLEFPKNGLVFITGRSGSGKSTLLNLLAGFDFPTSGSIFDGDIEITKFTKQEFSNYRQSTIGYISQDFHLIEDMSVIDNIKIGLTNKIDVELFETTIKYLELDKILKKKVINLSGGQRQRVAIARSLIKNPKVILADEPTGNLDYKNSNLVFNILKEISKKILVIVITHDSQAAKNFGDRIIELNNNSIVADSNVLQETKQDIEYKDHKKFMKKNLVNISKTFIFKNKLFLVISLLVLSFSLVFSSLVFMFANYDFISASSNAINSNEKEVLISYKNHYVSSNGSANANNLLATKNDFDNIYLSYDNLDYNYSVLAHNLIFSLSPTNSIFLKNHLSSLNISDTINVLDKFNYSLSYGHYPTSDNEICLTDYTLYTLYLLNSSLIDNILNMKFSSLNDDQLKEALNNLDEEIKTLIFGTDYNTKIQDSDVIKEIKFNPGLLLIGQNLDLSSNSFIISGGVKTNSLEKYKDLIYADSSTYYLDERYFDFNYEVNYLLYSAFITSKAYANLYSNVLFNYLNGTVLCPVSNTSYFYGEQVELNDDEIILTNTEFRQYFHEDEFDSTKEYKYTFTYQQVYADGFINQLITKDYLVKNVVSLDNNNYYIYADMIFTNDNEYKSLSSEIKDKSYMYCMINTSSVSLKTFLTYLVNNGYLFLTSNSILLVYVNLIISLFEAIVTIVGIILLVISIILIFFFFFYIVTKRKRDIGILSSLGYNIYDIAKIYLFGGGILAGIEIILSFILFFISFTFFNQLLTSTIASYVGMTQNTGYLVFSLSYIPFVLIPLVIIFTFLISILFSIYRANKISPIDTIKQT